MSTDSLYLWMFGIPIAVVVVAIMAASAAQERRAKLLAETGRRAIGRVLDTGYDGDGVSGPNYWVRVEYPYDGVLVTAKVYVSYKVQQHYRVGQRIGLTYSATRPKIVRLDSPDFSVPNASVPNPVVPMPSVPRASLSVRDLRSGWRPFV